MDMECKFEQIFDNTRNLQYVNGEVAVMHCHHYSAIFTRLALNTVDFGGPENLFEAMEETSYLTLLRYFTVENIVSSEEKITIAEQYFSLSGLGKVSFDITGQGGTASMSYSHMDEGWIKKWGNSRKPVNLIGQGYIAGAMSVIFDNPIGTYAVKETQSIVSGNKTSEFIIKKR
jgi:hypothetical protein